MSVKKQHSSTGRRRANSDPPAQCPTGLLVIDRQGTVLTTSTCFQDYSGFAASELVGMHIDELIGPQERARLLQNLADSRLPDCCSRITVRKKRGKSEQCFVCGMVISVGDTLLHLLSVTNTRTEKALQSTLKKSHKELQQAILDRDREIREFTASLIETNVELRREIREHHLAAELLRQSEARFRNLTEATSDFIWEINKDGLYTYASPKIFKLLGYQPEELIGKRFLMLQDPAMTARFVREIEQCPDAVQGFSNWHYRCRHRDGRTIVIESSGEPIIAAKGAIVGFRGIDRDITERVTYENTLRQAKEIAESADRAKSEFLANMSHELRTPLHAILSFAKHGVKKISTCSREDLLKFFLQIESSANRLLPLINSLLDLAKLEARKMDYDIRHDSILPDVEAAVNEIVHLAEQKKVRIDIDRQSGLTMVFFDQAALGNIIRNLLSNAVKFCIDNSIITISFAVTEDHYNRPVLRTTVANTGIAIPDNELESIFDKFVQSSRTRTGAGGTGLGLAICRQVLFDLHGRIWAENSQDGRTLFHFTLPITRKPGRIGQILIDRGLVTRKDLEEALLDQEQHP
jgi:PAS domain S-box-containing protein